MATAAWNTTLGAMEWLLLPQLVPRNGFYYGYRCQEYSSRCYKVASAKAIGAMEWLLLRLLLLEISQSVLWSSLCYGSRCYEMASTMATAIRNKAVGAMEWPLLRQSVI